jgi:hypothetical protein
LRILMSDTLAGVRPNDPSKRTWMIASSCVGIAGAAATAVPFVSTFQPSERAKAAGAAVEVDISAIKPGEKITVEWRGKPVWVVRRTPEQLAALPTLNSGLADPESKRKQDELTPINLSTSSRSAFAPIWVVRHRTSFKAARKLPCPMTGRAVFCALAMAPRLIWRDACSRTSLPRTI